MTSIFMALTLTLTRAGHGGGRVCMGGGRPGIHGDALEISSGDERKI